MLDIGWSELLVIGIVALIVVGPKDLPIMFRRMGEFTGRMRRLARDFQRAMNDAADEAGVSDVQRGLRDIANPKKMGLDALKDATDDLKAWKPDETTGPATRKLAEERADAKRKVSDAMAEASRRREAREATERSAAAEAAPEPEATEPTGPSRAEG
jgi:sec-independent protein translocase protein TatB